MFWVQVLWEFSLPVDDFPFHFPNGVFQRAEVLILKSQFINFFFFMANAFCFFFKKTLSFKGHKGFLMCFSISCIVLVLTFRSLVIWGNFCEWWEVSVEVYFFPYGCPVVPLFIEKTILPLWVTLTLSLEINWPYECESIDGLNGVPSIYMSILMPTLYFLNCHSFL